MPETQSVATNKIGTFMKAMAETHWRLFVAEGIVLIGLGLFAIILPLVAGLATTIFLGAVFIAAGGIGLATSLLMPKAPAITWSVISAVLALSVGLVLLFYPLRGMITLTFVLVSYFIADGVIGMFMAISHRRELADKWEWMMITGVIDLILAAILISGMPGTYAWALGLLVGIDMIFGGCTLIAMAMAARVAEGEI